MPLLSECHPCMYTEWNGQYSRIRQNLVLPSVCKQTCPHLQPPMRYERHLVTVDCGLILLTNQPLQSAAGYTSCIRPRMNLQALAAGHGGKQRASATQIRVLAAFFPADHKFCIQIGIYQIQGAYKRLPSARHACLSDPTPIGATNRSTICCTGPPSRQHNTAASSLASGWARLETHRRIRWRVGLLEWPNQAPKDPRSRG